MPAVGQSAPQLAAVRALPTLLAGPAHSSLGERVLLGGKMRVKVASGDEALGRGDLAGAGEDVPREDRRRGAEKIVIER